MHGVQEPELFPNEEKEDHQRKVGVQEILTALPETPGTPDSSAAEVSTCGAVARVLRQGGAEQYFPLLRVSAEERRQFEEKGTLGNEHLGIVGVQCHPEELTGQPWARALFKSFVASAARRPVPSSSR